MSTLLVATVGGHLTTSVEVDWFRLTAEVPLSPGRSTGPGPGRALPGTHTGGGVYTRTVLNPAAAIAAKSSRTVASAGY